MKLSFRRKDLLLRDSPPFHLYVKANVRTNGNSSFRGGAENLQSLSQSVCYPLCFDSLKPEPLVLSFSFSSSSSSLKEMFAAKKTKLGDKKKKLGMKMKSPFCQASYPSSSSSRHDTFLKEQKERGVE